MKAHSRWLACDSCGVLRDHVPDVTGLTPFAKRSRIETWICTVCGCRHPLAPLHSDQAVRERLERLGQLRLIE